MICEKRFINILCLAYCLSKEWNLDCPPHLKRSNTQLTELSCENALLLSYIILRGDVNFYCNSLSSFFECNFVIENGGWGISLIFEAG